MNRRIITEMNTTLSRMEAKPRKRRLTVEGLVLGEDDDYISGEEMGRDFATEQERPTRVEPTASPMADIKSVIKDIRLQVLNGLAKIAEHPETEEYDTLKRILIICDKPAEQDKKSRNEQK